MRRTWRKGSYTGDSERHVKEGFGNGTFLSFYTLHEGNLEEGLLYWGLRETHVIEGFGNGTFLCIYVYLRGT
jgi:hypothetical protein